MTYGLEEFCNDCRSAIDPASKEADLDTIRGHLEHLMENDDFVNEHCGPHAEVGVHTIYRDPETDFMVLAHINSKGRTSPPHDHGASWAVYAQAVEFTEMTEFDRKDDGSKEGYADLEISKKYRLERPKAGHFGPHKVHAIHFPDNGRFVRVTGTDLSRLETLRYNMDEKSVTAIPPNNRGEISGTASV